MGTIQKEIHKHPVMQYLNSLTSPHSKRSMRSALRTALAVAQGVELAEISDPAIFEFGWPQVGAAELEALKAALLERYSTSQAAKVLAAVRGVLKMCAREGMIDPEAWMQLSLVDGVKTQRRGKVGRRLTDGEILALAKACADDAGPAGARDDAILGLGFTQGPRVSEIVGLQVGDYDAGTGNLAIRNGKGGKDRTIRAANSTKDSLEEWLGFRGSGAGPLFCPVNKSDHVKQAGLSSTALQAMLHKRAAQAGVKIFSAHDLRRTFLTNGWAAGIPGTQLQAIAGHSSIDTTARYDRGDLETALTNTAGRLHYPSGRDRRRKIKL